jgi:putative methylase
VGTTAQKRLVRRLNLELWLQQIEPHPSPKVFLEQYTIPVDVAAEMLSIAAYAQDDIMGKIAADLGCGTGRLALGAAFLGAANVVGVDVDKNALRIARSNADRTSLEEKTDWVVGDIRVLHGRFDTVLQNPPFGVQRRRADQEFLVKALELASVVYSLHKSGESNRAFIKRFIERHGGKVTGVYQMKLNIPRMFQFHTERKHEATVDLYRIESRRSE